MNILLAQLPNALSVTRVVFGIILIKFCPQGALLFVILFCAAISDALDGFIARRLGVQSEIGAVLDLAADGIFFLCALLLLFFLDLLPGIWLGVILAGAIPEIAAQAIVWWGGGKSGSFGHPVNKMLGVYTYFFIIAVAMEWSLMLFGSLLVMLQWLANGYDLLLALTKVPKTV